MAGGITFTLDFEDHWADPSGELRYEQLAWEGEIALDEGPGHQGPAWVTRWVAQAP